MPVNAKCSQNNIFLVFSTKLDVDYRIRLAKNMLSRTSAETERANEIDRQA